MRVRLSVDPEPKLKRRLKVAAALRNVSVKEFIEQALQRELDSQLPEIQALDRGWLEGDLSGLGAYEPYEWQEGELDEGQPMTPEPAGGR